MFKISLKAKNIEEIIKDKNGHNLVRGDYENALISYTTMIKETKASGMEFNYKIEKIKLRSSVDKKNAELNFLGVISTLLALGITIIVAIVVGMVGSVSIEEFHKLDIYEAIKLVTVKIFPFAFIAILAIIAYDNLKNKYIKEIYYLNVCLEVLDEIEKEPQVIKTQQEVAIAVENNFVILKLKMVEI